MSLLSVQKVRQHSSLQKVDFWSEFQYIFWLFLATRISLLMVGSLAQALLKPEYGKQYVWSKYPFLDLWGVWDSFWYMNIAEQGYALAGSNPASPEQTNLAFFPLYPMLMRLLGGLLGGEYYVAGLFISSACVLISGVLLHQLVKLDNDRKVAVNSVKYLYLYPVSFIFSGVFTESLYLALTLTCFYCAKKNRWAGAGVAGAFLSATRSLGLLIVLPLAWEYFKQRNFKLQRLRPNVLFLALIPLGLVMFAAYNYSLSGDFFFFKGNLSAWDRESTSPLTAILGGLKDSFFDQNPKKALEVSFCLVSLSTLTIFFRNIDFSYGLFSLYSILIPLTHDIDSIARYTLPVFPLFIILAKLARNESVDQGLTLFLGILQGGLMVFWCMGFSLVV